MKLKIGACHEKMKGIFGYRRMQVWLERTYCIHVNHKRVQRLMGELGIRAVIRRKRSYYGKKEAYVLSGNHLNREFIANQTNQKWVTWIVNTKLDNFFMVPLLEFSRTQVIQRTVNPNMVKPVHIVM
ncbi:IS3 family transposase [Paenibacillus sp. RC73]|uniref:IS3 family transposase n=1 Tax=Paenibacillus sp. RC73 TaxID=3156250 RepID=UPI00384BE6FA